jgi:drug/metabolite transporter (DMT)-like permease
VSAVVSLLDKTVMYRYAHHPMTLPLLIGISQTTVGILVLAFAGLPAEATLTNVALAASSGLLFGLGGQILIRILYTQEVSRTIPVFHTFPLFAAIVAFVFLDERLTIVQWLAVFATVVGAVLLSVRIDAKYRTFLLHRSFFCLMVGSAIAGSAHVAGKAAVDELPVLFTHGVRMLALGILFLGFNARRGPYEEVRAFVRERSRALLFVGANELVIANASLLVALYALSLGPASLVTALLGTRSLFVVAYSVTLALVWKGALGEETHRSAVVVKVIATAVIVAGITGITL